MKTVLIVDDIPFVRQTLKQILQEARYQVVGEAGDGQEALQMYAKLRPDIVTMDIVMPRLGGIEAARKILKLHKDARILIISAMGQESLVMEAINVGARDFILKPFSAADVIKALDRITQAEDPHAGRASRHP